MVFDLSPLSVDHAYIFLTVFAATFALIGIHIRRTSPSIVYAGLPLVVVVVATAWLGLGGPLLFLGFIIASLLIAFVGGLDEQVKLSAGGQFIAQLIIVASLTVTGWNIPYVTNIFGDGLIYLSQTFFFSSLLLFAPLWTAIWILFVMNAMNWLDGVDGLASGTGIAAFIVLGFISLLPATQDGNTLTLAIIGAAAFLGFFLWNAPPAKAYLGTTGSWFLGMCIALVAMQGGGKIATAILVLAIPLLDMGIVIIKRLVRGQAPWQGDKELHVHYRLQNLGLQPLHIVMTIVGLSALLGIVAVLGKTNFKLILLLILALVFFAITFPELFPNLKNRLKARRAIVK